MRRSRSARVDVLRCIVLAGVMLVAALAIAPAAGPNSAPSPSTARGAGGTGGGVSVVPLNLTLASSSFPLSPDFWGATVSPRAFLLPNEAQILEAAHVRTLVWPGAGAGEEYDPFNNTLVTVANGTLTWENASTSETQFAALCAAIQCTAILQVPGEIDNPALAAQVVNYTERALGLHPSSWEIGNEPEYWNHWRAPWARWSASPTSPPTPLQYAFEVQNYTRAMQRVDPTLRVIGLPGTGRPHAGLSLSDWINATIAVNGPNLSGIAFHSYPGGIASPTTATLVNFYASLNSSAGIPDRVANARATISQDLAARCPTCAPVPVFVTEIGSALAHGSYGPYSVGYAGALAISAMLTQAMSENVTNVDLFASVMNTSNSWFDFQHNVRPDYTAYSDLLSHLGPIVYRGAWTSPAPGYGGGPTSLLSDVFAIATVDPADHLRTDLLVINLNLTTRVEFAPSLPGIESPVPTEVSQWVGTLAPGASPTGEVVDPLTPAPVASYFPTGMPATWELPAQGIALFEAYPQGGAPLTLPVAGLPNGTRWFVASGPHVTTSTGPTMTLFEPMGSAAVTPVAIPAPADGNVSRLRLAASAPAPISVNGPATVGIDYRPQWFLNLSSDDPARGSVTPSSGWWFAGAPLPVTAVAAPGFSFTHWVGFGSGSRNASTATIEVWANSSLREAAFFAPAVPVRFVAVGLPNGTTWSVTILGLRESASNGTITFPEINRTVGYSVEGPSSYRETPQNGSVRIQGVPLDVPIVFTPVWHAPPVYAVTFVETGLPGGTAWSVTVRGVVIVSARPTIVVPEANGSFGYVVGAVPGFRSSPVSDGFVVQGGPLTLPISFSPPRQTYPVTWHAQGLWQGTAWWVALDGTRYAANSSTLAINLSVGPHLYTAGSPAGFWPAPGSGQVVVTTGGFDVVLSFSQVLYPVLLTEHGLPSGSAWGIRFGSVHQEAIRSSIALAQPNGTYSFDISAPSGYFPAPSHGNLTVLAGPVEIVVEFLPGHAIVPPVWMLGGEALGAAAMMAAGAYIVRFAVRARRARSAKSGAPPTGPA